MRKLLMASAAVLGATGSLAFAQAPANPSQGQLAAPYGAGPAINNNNNAWGIANTPSGSSAAGPLSTIYAPNVNKVPAPGTIVIRLNGRVEVDVGAAFTSASTGVGANAGYKVNPVGIGSYMRLYPAFDGLAANGLRYGASVELRENFSSGANGTAISPSGNTSGETIYVRRAFTYLASDNVGLVRLGQGEGVLGLFDNCIFTSQCWDAGLSDISNGANQNIAPQAAAGIPFVWLAGSGAEYGNNKIVYLSPQFYGFDFGAQYAPSMGNAFQNGSSASAFQATLCNQAGPNCVGLTSGNDPTRWYNQVGVGVRYQQTFGAVDVKGYGFYETAGKENLTTAAYTAPAPNGGTGTLRYDNLSFYKAGVAVTAMNFTLAADYIGGAVNGQLQMRPTGGVSENAVLTGLTYSNGPLTLGSQFGFIDSQGAAQLTHTSQRHEFIMALGGNYKLAPGLQLVAEYQYWQRHQGGWDFANNAPGAGATTTAAGLTRDAHGQSLVLATVLTW